MSSNPVAVRIWFVLILDPGIAFKAGVKQSLQLSIYAVIISLSGQENTPDATVSQRSKALDRYSPDPEISKLRSNRARKME